MSKTPTSPDPDEVVVRPFSDWVREQGKGATHEELSEKLHELVGRVRDTGRKGQLVFTVTVQPLKGNTDVLQVTDTVVAKLPQHDKKASIFYPDAEGNLTRTDPNQLQFDGLRDASADRVTGEIKEKQA